LCDEHVEYWVYELVRGGDLAWVVLSIDDPLDGLELVTRLLVPKAIRLVPARPQPSAGAGAEPESETPHANERQPGWKYLPAILVITGADRPGAQQDLAVVDELLGATWRCAAVSATAGEGMGPLGSLTFDALGIIRVYTKEPGHEPDLKRPFTLPIGATVANLARTIHGDIAEHLKYARLWGPATFDGQRVKSDHVLTDGDVVELRA
jgi:hypothetical protein